MEITLSLPMLLFLMLMTGFAGFVDSAAGGGGLISLPAYLFAGLPVHYTYGTNKFSAACGTTFATAQFFQKGAMNIRVGLLAAVGSFVGSALGSHIVLLLSDQVLRTMMLIILPVAAVLILWRRDLPDENRDDGTLNLKKILLALGIGLVLAWVVVSVMKSQLRSVAFQENAASYVREGSMNLTNSRELFLYRDVQRTEHVEEKDSDSSGGSSTHTSSSGTTHGGGGGSF